MILKSIYPNGPLNIQPLSLGVYTKEELYQLLTVHSIQMNELGQQFFNDSRFTVSKTMLSLNTVELKVSNLGFEKGATLPQVFAKAKELGLGLCPLEVGPLLRLTNKEQGEGALHKPPTKNQAPYGSLTIASPLLSTDETFPKGFYLRKIEGELWLRGYTCDDSHLFHPDDYFVFCTH